MKRPPSFGQHCRMGKSSSEKLSRLMTSLQGPVGDRLREELSHLGQHGQHLYFVEKSLRRFHVHEAADAFGDFVERVDFKGQPHAARGTELVDEKFLAGIALEILEEQRLAAERFPAGQLLFETRSVISVISRIGSASVRMRFSSPARSRAWIQSRRSS